MAILELTPEQRAELEALSAPDAVAPLVGRRARILLLADGGEGPGLDLDEICKELKIGRALVRNTCRRLVEKDLDAALKRPKLRALAAPPLVAEPTPRSVGLGLLAGARPVDLRLDVGTRHEELRLAAKEARTVIIDGLSPGERRSYRLQARTEDVTDTYNGILRACPEPGAEFRFAVLADVHLPILAMNQWLDRKSGPLAALIRYGRARGQVADVLRRVLRSIRRLEVDFVVSLGDLLHVAAQTPDPRMPLPDLQGAYEDLRSLLGELGSDTPFFPVLGNWDGESGWLAEPLRRAARQARVRSLPTPNGRSYFTWTWGDALFVALDVTGFTTREPRPGGEPPWTLGAEQWEWLEATLKSSGHRFKILFMHHPLAGHGGDADNTAYARGGGRAADRGEQAVIQGLAERHGVQIIFYGHDHVFVDTTVRGVHYTLPGSAGAPWKFTGESTGYETFDRRSGFATVEVSADRLQVDFRDVDGERFGGYGSDEARKALGAASQRGLSQGSRADSTD